MASIIADKANAASDLPSQNVEVLVVGFGMAGACAAMHGIETLEKNNTRAEDDIASRILIVDRFDGGGATCRSGGIIYLGGGTDAQKELGINDDAHNMYRYLQAETDGSVSNKTLWRFCAESASTAAWLRDSFDLNINRPDEAVLCPFKTRASPFCDLADPAPRGHKASGPGSLIGTGPYLWSAIEKSVLALEPRGVNVQTQTKVVELLFEGEAVTGARLLTLKHAPAWVRKLHYSMATYLGLVGNPVHIGKKTLQKSLEALENKWGRFQNVYATRGVILSTGGFSKNDELTQEYVPIKRQGMAIGSAGDTGDGIFQLGVSQANAATKNLDRASLWKFIVPAASMAKCVAVSPNGERLINEDVYGARLGDKLADMGNGKGWLVMDQTIFDECRNQMMTAGKEMLAFQKGFTVINLFWNREKADTLEDLAKATGVDSAALTKTIERYNNDVRNGEDKQFHKKKSLLSEISKGPFYAIRADYAGTLWPSPFMTLGGLYVNEDSGQVMSIAGNEIPGLFAAGRAASGVCAKSYVSGLSLGDCIFSGRRAAEFLCNDGSIWGADKDDIAVTN